ncbi:MAG TPA: hypothetical protein DCE42_15000 [Myxococcales bacterium]|nr:hypothetical protein [Deltaproteobacteria bacterium]MBU53881.1 hypothetical protein [Deltaproteobacteria bacterium]HAA56071.1 hypothetical protein [Myxococcales bacterium]
MRGITIVLCCIGTLLLPLSKSEAQGKPKVGVFPLQSVEQSLPKRELKTLSEQLVSRMELSNKFQVLKKQPYAGAPLPAQSGPKWDAERDKQLRELSQHLQNAAKAMKAGAFEKAIPILKKGIKKGVAAIRWEGSFKLLARMCGLMSLAYLQLGQNDAGEFLLKTLAILRPNPLPPEISKNRIMSFRYKRALRDIKAGERGSLQIIGMSNVDVYMDGKKQGQIPTVVANLPVGIHYLQVRRKGHIPWGRAIRIKAGTHQVSVSLQPIPQPKVTHIQKVAQQLKTHVQLLSVSTPSFQANAKELCDKTDARWVVTGHIKKANSFYLITPIKVDCTDGKAVTYENIQLDGELLEVESKFSEMLKTLFAPPKAVVVRRTPVIRPRESAPKRNVVAVIPPKRRPDQRDPGKTTQARPVHEQWWFWTIIGVTAVGAGTATAVVLLQPPRINVTATWPTP